MTQDQSVLAAQRAEDRTFCSFLRMEPVASFGASDALLNFILSQKQIDLRAATRIEQLSQELREACHDRDRFQADAERLRAEKTNV